jgi:hypothetical protein
LNVGHDGDRCRHLAQDVLVGVDDVHQPAVVAQVVQAAASAITACRQAPASWARLVGPMVTAKQYVVA